MLYLLAQKNHKWSYIQLPGKNCQRWMIFRTVLNLKIEKFYVTKKSVQHVLKHIKMGFGTRKIPKFVATQL